MNNGAFNQIMTLAYISAMIMSSISQVRGTTILACALDPRAPRAISSSMMPSTLTAEKLESIRRRALANPMTATIESDLASLFGLAKEAIPAKQLSRKFPDVKYYINFSLQPNTDDIVFVVMEPGISHIYLTDSSRDLRAAILADASGGRLITRAAAADGYEKVLRVWAAFDASRLQRPMNAG